MSMFKNMLGAGESLIINEAALSYEFLPKLIPYRENQQFAIANAIKPLFNERSGRNLLIYGPPGIGKTAATKHVLRELEEETDEIIPLYINCWKYNTSYKIVKFICEDLGYKFTQNKNTEELFQIAKNIINKKSAIFVFDEVDKLDDTNVLYFILEEIYKKAIILITNYPEWTNSFDVRIKSRLVPERIEFKPYDKEETKGILEQRIDYALVPEVLKKDAFNIIVNKTFDLKDIRTGLFLLKESALIAEEKSKKKIELEDVEKAISKITDFSIKDKENLREDIKDILEVIKKYSGEKIGFIHDKYEQEFGVKMNYKTFQRRIQKLKEDKFIDVEKTGGGKEGNTTIIKYSTIKKLNEF